MKLGFSRQVSEKLLKFHENPSSDCRVVPWPRRDWCTGRQTYRHDEAHNRFSQFCERSLKCNPLSESAWLPKMPLNFCSLLLFKQNRYGFQVTLWMVQLRIITKLQSVVMKLVESIIHCFNGRMACTSSNVFSNENETEMRFNKIYLLLSDTTYNIVYRNMYGRLVSVNWDHLQALYIKRRENCLWYIKMQMLMLKSIENLDIGSHLHC